MALNLNPTTLDYWTEVLAIVSSDRLQDGRLKPSDDWNAVNRLLNECLTNIVVLWVFLSTDAVLTKMKVQIVVVHLEDAANDFQNLVVLFATNFVVDPQTIFVVDIY